jgi:hypothetical protein
MKPSLTVQMLILLGMLAGWTFGQDITRVKIAAGEYSVSTDEDLGVGPIETEVFHFHESWTLWHTADGNYEVDGERTFESPRDIVHQNRFWAQLTRDLQLVKVKEFAKLRWRPDSGPLTCDLRPHEMRCNSGGKDPVKSIDIQVTTHQPYGIIWPISVFSLGSLAYVAAEHEGELVPVELVTFKELNEALPVLTIQSSGSIRYLGRSEVKFTASGTSWYPRMFELTSSRTRTLHIWTSHEGLVLAIERADWPKTTLRLVSFQQFAEFPRGD